MTTSKPHPAWAKMTFPQELIGRLAAYTRDPETGKAVFHRGAITRRDFWGRLQLGRAPAEHGAWARCGPGGYIALTCTPWDEPEGAADTEPAERLLALLGAVAGTAEPPPVRLVGASMIHGWAALLRVDEARLLRTPRSLAGGWIVRLAVETGGEGPSEAGGMALFGLDPYLREYTWPRGFGEVPMTRERVQAYMTAADALLGARGRKIWRWRPRALEDLPYARQRPEDWPLLRNRCTREWREGLFADPGRRQEIQDRLRGWMVANELRGWPVPPSLEYIAWHVLLVDLCEEGTERLARGLRDALHALGYWEYTARSRGGCRFAKLWTRSRAEALTACRF